jgi:hypothetical protein
MPDNILKELCVVALLEQWKEQNFTGKVINRNTVKPILRVGIRDFSHFQILI